MKYIRFLFLLLLSSCINSTGTPLSGESFQLGETSSVPFNISNIDFSFYSDISYGQFNDNKLDLFLPESDSPSALVIFIHGGGFTSGDKTQNYDSSAFQDIVRQLLAENIALASINYRFIEQGDNEGILKCLNDSKRALQFIRYNSSLLNIDENRIALWGGSAGAGTSLWLGFSDDMADENSSDPISRESTRIQSLVVMETQATYDVLLWDSIIFERYLIDGFNFQSVRDLLSDNYILNIYGIASADEFFSEEANLYRERVNLINLISADDPEFYVLNEVIESNIPETSSELTHHPLHALKLYEQANRVGAKVVAYIPKEGIDTRNNESIADFLIRTVGSQ